jgi:hypothetical protein
MLVVILCFKHNNRAMCSIEKTSSFALLQFYHAFIMRNVFRYAIWDTPLKLPHTLLLHIPPPLSSHIYVYLSLCLHFFRVIISPKVFLGLISSAAILFWCSHHSISWNINLNCTALVSWFCNSSTYTRAVESPLE